MTKKFSAQTLALGFLSGAVALTAISKARASEPSDKDKQVCTDAFRHYRDSVAQILSSPDDPLAQAMLKDPPGAPAGAQKDAIETLANQASPETITNICDRDDGLAMVSGLQKSWDHMVARRTAKLAGALGKPPAPAPTK